MPAPAGEALDTKLHKLGVRQTVLKIRDAKKKLGGILRTNPHLWINLLDSARSLGYTEDGHTSSLTHGVEINRSVGAQALESTSGQIVFGRQSC